jgi:hypothetical protein
MEGGHVSDVIYLYGFVPSDLPAPPPLAGVGDGAVELVPLGAVSAVISRLPAAEWSVPLVEARLDDLAWVGEQGLAHERVVLWFVDHAEILPARLFSMYSDDAALRAAAAPRHDVLRSQVERLGGRREWNLKVAYDLNELGRHGGEVSDELRRMDDEIAGASPGRRFLLQRRRTDLTRREVTRAARRMADQLLDALRPHAEAVQALPLPEGADRGTVVLAAALLVSRAGEAALRAEAEPRIEQLSSLGMTISFTGPWAPYRFIDIEPGTHVDA